VRAAHDVSDGGLLIAVAEMLIAGSTSAHPLGAELAFDNEFPLMNSAFGEAPARYVLEVEATHDYLEWVGALPDGVWHYCLGTINDSGVLTDNEHGLSVPIADLARAWLGTLDW